MNWLDSLGSAVSEKSHEWQAIQSSKAEGITYLHKIVIFPTVRLTSQIKDPIPWTHSFTDFKTSKYTLLSCSSTPQSSILTWSAKGCCEATFQYTTYMYTSSCAYQIPVGQKIPECHLLEFWVVRYAIAMASTTSLHQKISSYPISLHPQVRHTTELKHTDQSCVAIRKPFKPVAAFHSLPLLSGFLIHSRRQQQNEINQKPFVAVALCMLSHERIIKSRFKPGLFIELFV